MVRKLTFFSLISENFVTTFMQRCTQRQLDVFQMPPYNIQIFHVYFFLDSLYFVQ